MAITYGKYQRLPASGLSTSKPVTASYTQTSSAIVGVASIISSSLGYMEDAESVRAVPEIEWAQVLLPTSGARISNSISAFITTGTMTSSNLQCYLTGQVAGSNQRWQILS